MSYSGKRGFNYDTNSQSFKAGAHKHWSGHKRTDEARVRLDRQQLERRTTKYHRFVPAS